MSMMDSTSSYDSQSQSQQWFSPAPMEGNSSSSSSLGLNISSLTVSPPHGHYAHQQQHHNHSHSPHHQRLQQQQQQQQYPNRPFPLRITTSSSSSSVNSGGSGSSSAPPSRKRSFTSNPSSASAGPSSAVLPSASTPGPNTADTDPNEPPDGTPTFSNAEGDIDMDNDFNSMPPSSAVSTTTSATFLGTPSGGASPIDGNNSGSGGDDDGNTGGLFGGNGTANGGSGSMREAPGILGGVGGIMGMLGKPMPTNNFVTKLYQMINDPKSAHFITWTELGTSFVVSNVGEFSRSILGSHFKHNNFSSFVRQLNMYGFHKINRTPRAQRTSTDAQTWEFSHHKFLRGRPDLLDEIKRKALEPDPGVKQRVELPGEVAAQLNSMREDNRRMWEQLTAERRKVERLTGVVSRLWDFVGKGFPGSIPPFPLTDLLDGSQLPVPSSTVPSSTPSVPSSTSSNAASVNGTGNNAGSESDNPNIYITSPTATSPPTARYGAAGGAGGHNHFGLNMSPGSSPTTMDFPSHIHGHNQMQGHQPFHHQHHPHQQHHQPHHLSRQHSFPLNSYGSRSGSPHPGNEQGADVAGSGNAQSNVTDMFEDGSMSSSSSVISPTGGDGDGPGDGPGQTITGRGSTKRQRMSTSVDDLPSFTSHTHQHHGHMGVGVHGVVGGVGSPFQQQSPLQSPQQVPANAQPFLSPPDSKKFSTRARSDSAPLGYGGMGMAGGGGGTLSPWSGPGGSGILGRPRSGSGLLHVGQNRGMMVRGAGGNMAGNGGQGLGLQVPNNNAPGGQSGR
ncbi:hypothetical protein V5O48_009952 [Marasmius crinis-equi]|uniref:HSF-type DNA-binding domain-containing protein n=1 Tax=Marasmius crinis-equi TaxID=585013 RepID=A0ABR3F9M6_9AGAR